LTGSSLLFFSFQLLLSINFCTFWWCLCFYFKKNKTKSRRQFK